jgi:predicted metalloprotease
MRFGNDDSDRSNVEDDRGSSGGGGGIGGIHLGIGGFVVVGILSLVFKTNLFALLGSGSSSGPATQTTAPAVNSPQAQQRKAAEAAPEKIAVSAFNDVQHFWGKELPNKWQDAKLVLFWDQVNSGCGGAEAAMGPFYCPRDQKVYIDLGFYKELAQRFGAPGEFAQAYVIAHELGHHLQDELGITKRVQGGGPATSVKVELQADCFAGVWGHNAAQRNLLDPGEAQQGLRAAASVGDDRIAKMTGHRANPETFTHGSAEQRMHWFGRGMQSGSLKDCDTFAQ